MKASQKRLAQFAVNVTQCDKCRLYQEWNDELREEKQKLLDLLYNQEHKEIDIEKFQQLKPLSSRSGFRTARAKLERKYSKIKIDSGGLEQSEETKDTTVLNG